MTYDSTILADSPIRYYKMQETSGTVANDAGSQAQNGTLNGTYTLNQTKLAVGLGACIKFDGSTGYISLPTTSLPTGASAWTLECWLNLTSIPGSGFQLVVVMGLNGSQQWAQIGIKNSTSVVECGFFNGPVLDSSAIVTGTTYYCVVTYDGATLRAYLNAASQGSISGTGNLSQSFAYIAKDNAGDFTNGYISNVAIYSAALNQTQITAHYNAGITAASNKLRISDGYGGVFS